MTENKSVVGQGTGGVDRGGREGLPRGMGKLLGVMDVFIILTVAMVSWEYTYVKTDQILYFEYMQFIICQLYTIKLVLKKKA